MKLTDAKIRGLKPRNKRFIVWSDNGLGARVSGKGKISFVYQYRVNGKSKLMTLGAYPNIGLDTANLKLHDAQQILLKGQDPGAVNIEKKKIERQAPTVNEFIQEFLQKHSIPNKKTWEEDKRVLEKELAPDLGHKKMKDISKREIISILDNIVLRGAPAMANRTLNVISNRAG